MTREQLIEAIVEQFLGEANWIQKATASIKRRGTEGKFTAEARKAGYPDTLEYARAVMSGKVKGNKKRANFALNVNKRKK